MAKQGFFVVNLLCSVANTPFELQNLAHFNPSTQLLSSWWLNDRINIAAISYLKHNL
jgi:hypothetical protein